MKQRSSRTSIILIDGSNLHAACQALGFSVDYKKLLESFEGTIHRAYYFTALPPATEQSTLRPMVDYLEFNGFTVIQKVWKEFVDKDGKSRTKGNMDIEIAVHAYEQARYVDDTFLFSGDGDFRCLVESLQRNYGHKVTVISTIQSSPALCADALRRQADTFLDLADMREAIERTEDQRSVRRRNFINNVEG